MPSFEQRFQMNPSIGKSTKVLITNDPNVGFPKWFGNRGNHLAVLMLGWAYALSARWTVIIPRAAPIEYTGIQARWAGDQSHASEDTTTIVVELRVVNDDAARWWAAVLAPGAGWKASIPHERYQLLSPWTVTLESMPAMLLSGTSKNAAHSSRFPPSFEAAVRYIEEYSALHSAKDQNRAALAAALLLPLANLDCRRVSLPPPQMCYGGASSMASPIPIWGQDLRQLDRLLTLSCNSWGMKSILGSLFYEPEIPCNVCGAWLQGTIAVLQSEYAQDLHILACMFFIRGPRLSFLWLGAMITGAHKSFLRNLHGLLGLNRIDLHEAAWTGTVLSFIQEPVSYLPNETNSITRADECRLEYLCQGAYKERSPPIYPYPPPGATAIEDLNLDVRTHALCPGKHGLRFSKIRWTCVGGRNEIQEAENICTLSRDTTNLPWPDTGEAAFVPDCHRLHPRMDLSDMVTRNVFMWMREIDGFPIAERAIYHHEWLDGLHRDPHCTVDACRAKDQEWSKAEVGEIRQVIETRWV
ncbi:hypothetical protein HRG_004556 [Hirsutella rhossiliensis]|uniref:Uncharacterized protein n=1 Tax=Hirsutella rhossiliensis TaxID=111463 RepID=A0A9P8SIE8_9HYPO|nr:uncharacterized protein HRG_04556 [Hirsutella rhossiliensis]KAH0964128.1 hypothetical protein HRG_04556 [Hirsutella rhossiliensis]